MERKFSEKHNPEKLSLSPPPPTDPNTNDPDPVIDTATPYSLPDPDVQTEVSEGKTVTDGGVQLEDEEPNDHVHVTETNPDDDPEIHCTLETSSQEIDRFLSGFAADGKGVKETVLEEPRDVGDDEKKEKEEMGAVEIPVFVDRFLDLVEERVGEREVSEGKGKRLWLQFPEDDASFLEAVNRTSRLIACLERFRSRLECGALVNRAGGVHQRAMSYLEEEFRMFLEDVRNNNESNPSHSHDSSSKGKQREETDRCTLQDPEPHEGDNFSGYPDEVIANMNLIAKEMIEGGFESECCQIYMIIRRQAFDECLSKTGFEYITIEEVQKMHWDALEKEILMWIKTFKDSTTVYFCKERELADAVFSSSPSLSSSLFNDLSRGVAIQLLNFAEGVAMTKRSAEKLFKFLDMYEALHDSVPAINNLFPQSEMKAETFSARSRIGEAAICMFCDLENSIKSDTGKTQVPGGAVHPLTRYTMNYLKYSCEYKATLEQVFREHSRIERADSTSRSNFQCNNNKTRDSHNTTTNEDPETTPLSPFSNQLIRVMDLLDTNLEAKSKLYRDIALSSIFMMNNGRYILQKIRSSVEIHQAMGDTWCRKKSSELRNYHKSYQRETWGKLLGCLGHEGLQVNGKVVKPVLKERFKSFNIMFDEIHKTQSSWVVSDEQLQSELRVSISAVVIPAYRSFIGRFSQYLDPGRQSEKYIKYQPEDIETYIDELFDGNPTSIARKRP